jgi:elongation factor G
VFEDKVRGGAIPREFIKPTADGIKDALSSGVIAGFPVIDVQVSLVDGDFHEVDSSDLAFRMAGSMALKEAVQKAGPKLLEPIMRVEVVTPEEYLGAVQGDISAKRGQIEAMEIRPGGAQALTAFVPLSEMFGYATDLRSMSQGRASFTMEFDHYSQLPATLTERLMRGETV